MQSSGWVMRKNMAFEPIGGEEDEKEPLPLPDDEEIDEMYEAQND